MILNNPFIDGVVASLVATAIVYCISRVWKNRKCLKLYGLTQIRPDETIRISAAYLFRIKVGGKYLLIRGNRIRSQYQPVGGVYKLFKSGKSYLEELSGCPDDSMGSTDTDSDDLRIQLPRKNALRFIEWFDSRKGREVSTLREFREELITSNYLPEKAMNDFNPEFIRSCERKLDYSEHLKMHEILIHEVYEIYLSEECQAVLIDYTNRNPAGDLVLAEKSDIDRSSICINGSFYSISQTAKRIL